MNANVFRLELAQPTAKKGPGRGGNHTAAHTRLVNEIRLALGMIPDLVLWSNPVKHIWATVGSGKKFRLRMGIAVGSADLLGCLAGRFFAIEVKTGKATLEPDQVDWHRMVRAKGGFTCVARSVAEAHAAVARCRMGAVA